MVNRAAAASMPPSYARWEDKTTAWCCRSELAFGGSLYLELATNYPF